MNRRTFGVVLLGVVGSIAVVAPSGAQLKDAGTTVRSPFRRIEEDQARDAPQRARLLTSLKKPATTAAIQIETWIHVIQKGPGTMEGNVPDSRIQAQVTALNSAYGAHGFQFVLKGTDSTTQPAW